MLSFLTGRTTRRLYEIPDDETPDSLPARDTGPGLRLLGTAAAAVLITFGLILIFEHGAGGANGRASWRPGHTTDRAMEQLCVTRDAWLLR